MIAMFMQFKDNGNQRWEPTMHPPNTCHVCFEDILIPDTPYEEASPAIILLDFPGHFSGMKLPHNAEQLISKSFGPSWYTDAFRNFGTLAERLGC